MSHFRHGRLALFKILLDRFEYFESDAIFGLLGLGYDLVLLAREAHGDECLLIALVRVVA